MKSLIFDFDWVIHDTFEFHRNKIIDYCKSNYSVEDFRDIHNWNIFDSIPPEPIKSEWWEWYRDFIYAEYSILKINKEIIDTILKLKENYTLHIITSWWTNNVRDLLRNNQLYDTFDDVLCYEFHKSKIFKFEYIFEKYRLTTKDCLFVTDTLWDILEANELWIKTIAVDFGFHERERLEKWNPYKIISSFNELLDI